MRNRSFLDHSQPSNLEVAGDVAILVATLCVGAAVGITLVTKDLIGRAFGRG